jgi:hypothetical protein
MWKQVVLFLSSLLLLASPLFGQTKADSISSTSPKFLIRNQKGQILLIFDANRQAWEVPGAQYAGPITFQDLADSVAKDYGIKYKKFKLAGLFTYHYPNRYKTVIRPYFTMLFTDFADGKRFRQGSRIQWFDPKKIRQVVFYPASVIIVEKIISEPKAVWAGAFEEYGYTNPMTDPAVVKFRVVEPLYQLR